MLYLRILPSFSYQKTEGQWYPIVPVTLVYQTKFVVTSGLVDSGANISLFRPEVAAALSIQIKKGKEIELRGLGGKVKGYLHKIDFLVAGVSFRSELVFLEKEMVNFNLLGRKGFFERFQIHFDETSKNLSLDAINWLPENPSKNRARRK